MNRSLIMLFALLIIAGCSTPTQDPAVFQKMVQDTVSAQDTLAAQRTDTPEPTETPAPGLDQDAKDFLMKQLLGVFDNPDSLLKCNDATWIEDVIKFRCELTNFIDEPKDHDFLHWSFIQNFAMFFKAQPDMFKNTTVELVTTAKRNGIEMLSSTSPATMDKVVAGTIATEIEWVREAEIIR